MTEQQPKRKWTVSPEKRARLEKALEAINRDYCDYIAGKKPRREYPFNLSAKGSG